MGRLLGTAIALVLLVAASSAAAGAPTAVGGSARFDCGTKALTFLFWPQGHDAIPSINFPMYRYPHMEIYKTSAGAYPNQNQVAGIGFSTTGQTYAAFAKTCTSKRSKIANSRPLRAKTTQAASLLCTFPKAAQLGSKKHSQGTTAVDLTVTLRSKSNQAPLEVQAYITGSGSTLRYDPKHCKAYPPPQ
ncbi:MAG: hypothetical protein WBB76_06010 [Gaiellaceae bacterium]